MSRIQESLKDDMSEIEEKFNIQKDQFHRFPVRNAFKRIMDNVHILPKEDFEKLHEKEQTVVFFEMNEETIQVIRLLVTLRFFIKSMIGAYPILFFIK